MTNVFYDIMMASNEMINQQTINQTSNTELVKSYLSLMSDNLQYYQGKIQHWADQAQKDEGSGSKHQTEVQADSAQMSSYSNQADNMKQLEGTIPNEMLKVNETDSNQSSNLVQSMESGTVYSTLNGLLSQPM